MPKQKLDTLAIRPAVDGDAVALQAIVAAAFAEYPGCVFDLSELPELVEPATAFARLGGRLWSADQEGVVVGCIAMVPAREPGLVELRKLYTLATVRGIGLGRRLIATAEAEARQWRASRIHLWTDTRFETAHRVYEKLGYRRLDETRELHDLSGSVEYHYEKWL